MRKKRLILTASTVLLIGALLCGCSAANEEKADLVVYGTIYTAEEENDGLAEAFAVKDGKYIYVGDKDGAKKYVEEGKTEVIDRTGEGLIIPGCTEGHSHYFDGTGLMMQLPANNCSYDEMLEALKEQVETQNIKQFVSVGWNAFEVMSQKGEDFNFAEEIESIAPGIPVVLVDNSGHNAVCNTTALKKVGLLDDPTLRGGVIVLAVNGKPSGFVKDQAVYYLLEKALDDPFTEEQYKTACDYAVNRLLELGYTNDLDAFSNFYGSDGLYAVLKKMDDANELKMNFAGCYCIKSYDADEYQSKVDEVVDLTSKYSGTHVHPEYIKLFADGVVEGGTGWITGEYLNAEKGAEHGNIIWTQDELNAIVQYANSKDVIIHTHSYGDAACKAMLNAYISSNEANNNQYRNCIAHVRNIQEEDIIRAAENKIPVAANLIWHYDYDENIPADKEMKDYLLNTMGEDYYYSGYPMKSLVDKGVFVSSSTDSPAGEAVAGSIMNVIEIATTGIGPGENAKAFVPQELLTVREVLKALTIDGAWQLGLEEERGSIKVGKYADFVILDKNILEYESEQLCTIGDTKILYTYFEGEKVYEA